MAQTISSAVRPIKTFSITDHDTIKGVEYLLNNKDLLGLLAVNNVKFVKGIEFSSIINVHKKM